jgi:PAS domain S-box-containing protein
MTVDTDAMLASVFAASLDCIVVIDEQGIVLEFNPSAEAAFGYARDQAIGSPISELIIPPQHRKSHNRGMARYVAGGEPRVVGRRVNVEAMRSDGSIFPAELALTEARMPCGRRIFTASVRDLTEQKEIEDALRESEARLEAFFENAPAAMYLKSCDGRYERVNDYTGTMMGYPAQELVGRHAKDVVRADEAEEVAELDRQVLESGKPLVTEQTFHTRGGREEASRQRGETDRLPRSRARRDVPQGRRWTLRHRQPLPRGTLRYPAGGPYRSSSRGVARRRDSRRGRENRSPDPRNRRAADRRDRIQHQHWQAVGTGDPLPGSR